jgi:hypothetical protein
MFYSPFEGIGLLLNQDQGQIPRGPVFQRGKAVKSSLTAHMLV